MSFQFSPYNYRKKFDLTRLGKEKDEKTNNNIQNTKTEKPELIKNSELRCSEMEASYPVSGLWFFLNHIYCSKLSNKLPLVILVYLGNL